jgi:hypothetical protein
MTTAQESSNYLSGQGVLLLATKDGTTGEPNSGFRAVGNVSALTIGNEVTEFEHKESQSGVRAVDITLVTEINVAVSMTMESLISENLAIALKGTAADVTASSVTDVAGVAYHDLWTPLEHINVSTFVLTNTGGIVTYTLDTDYELDAAAGAFRTLSTGTITDTQAVEWDYAYAIQETVDALTVASNPQRWARFHGLNTVDSDNPVVVDVYKMDITPLAELALINDEISQMAVEATALSDATRSTGSKFFTIRHSPTVT